MVEDLFKGILGNGLRIRFWLDCWLGSTPLRYKFPNLFALESEKGCSVAARLVLQGTSRVVGWVWKRQPLLDIEREELSCCQQLLLAAVFKAEPDSWSWAGDSSGCYSAAACRRLLSESAVPFFPFKWSKLVPKKVNIFAWRAEQDRISTMEGLVKRKILNSSPMCCVCGDYQENAAHLLIHCYVVAHIWQKVADWCKIPPIFAFNFRELFEAGNVNGLKRSKKEAIYAIILTTCWVIWNGRNKKVFQGKRINLDELLSEIKAQSHLWITSRSIGFSNDWNKWCSFDI